MVETDARDSTVAGDALGAATAAQLAISTLHANGVEAVFGIPGVHTLALYDALRDSPMRHILARHEQGAGFMADGYARASGRPGVAIIITGPGITNVATPVGEAFSDSSPVFVLSSNSERAYVDRMRGTLHDLKDQLGVMAAVTSWNARVDDPNRVAEAVTEAFRRMQTGRPQPVHVEILLDVLDEPAANARIPAPFHPARLEPDPASLADAAARLRAARKVAIFCGNGAADAGDHVVAIAERLGALVLTSVMGKGAVPEDHPRVVGALWEPGNPVDDLLCEADCLLVLGTSLGAETTRDFALPLPADLIRVDVDERQLTANATPTLGILGDATVTAAGIASLLAGAGAANLGYDHTAIAQARDAARATAFGADRSPYLAALRRAIPRDGILVNDMTMMSYAASALYPAYAPRTFLMPFVYGTLGFALPAAIGAKVARPDAAVVCVCGDGGFQYTMAEVATAVQHGIGVPIVIFDDSCYSAVKHAQATRRDGRTMAVDLVNPDFLALAAAYGIPGVRADSPDALESAVRTALTRDQPTIIDVPIKGWA